MYAIRSYYDVVSDVVITATFIDDTSVEENAIGLGWYPNPAQEYIILQGEYVGYLDFYNVSGVLIKQVFVSSNHQFIDVSDLNKGLYVIKAKNWCSRLVIK